MVEPLLPLTPEPEFLPAAPEVPEVKLATRCEHTDRPAKAYGMCQSCYRAGKGRADYDNQKRLQVVEEEVEQLDKAPELTPDQEEKNEPIKAELDFANDPALIQEFYQRMWAWVREGDQIKQEKIEYEVKGKKVRDYNAELRRQQVADARAAKGAAILGRAYIVERHSEEKPASLGVEGMGEIMQGWMGVASMKNSVIQKEHNQ